jgi:pimeloyl-ACP methyl ester carboxylesterase
MRAGAAVLLCVAGFIAARVNHFRQTTVMVNAGGCRLVTDIVDEGNDDVQGSVVLVHGLAANKKIMTYLARAFALENLRVFVPDLPGHGRTQGPFSFARAESCTETLVRQLSARGAIDPARTIIAGHSMGGAIAVLVANRVPVAGVVAISPAPMNPAHGVPAFMQPFGGAPKTPAHTLAMAGSLDPSAIQESARDLITGEAAATGKQILLPNATHVGILFDSRAARAAQEWAAQVLGLAAVTELPSNAMLVGSLAGFAGLLLLAGPFLREMLGVKPEGGAGEDALKRAPTARLIEVAMFSVVAVIVLRFWNPLRLVGVFEGDYLASFLLLLGVFLLLRHHKRVGGGWRVKAVPVVLAGVAAIVLHLLIIAWFDLTLSEAWLTGARLLRFPALALAVLPYHGAEELLVGNSAARPAKLRWAMALAFRLLGWGALMAGLFWLHSGEVLLLLLAPSLTLFCLLQRAGMDVVRRGTGSALAAAVFGAILLAGFCLVVFPIT